jgi:hypothetical protein
MENRNPDYFKPLEAFLMNDQPFICPHCGSRTEQLANFYHTKAKCAIEKCLNNECNFICYEEEDEYFLKLWGVI